MSTAAPIEPGTASPMKAIRFTRFGGAEVLEHCSLPVPIPAPGELLVRVEAVGINFKDIYERNGLYPLPLPAVPGSEVAGTVVAVGSGVPVTLIGTRVASAAVRGGYAEYAIAPEKGSVTVPEAVDPALAAAAFLQGLTAHYLCHSTYPVSAGTRCLIHAGAGGVGLLLIQMAKKRGAFVITTVSNEAKRALAKEAGADEVIIYTEQPFAEATMSITGGKGVQVVYDSVGKTTFDDSLNVLAPRGMLVSYGQSSGAVPPFDPLLLSKKGSLFLTRPTLGHYTATKEELDGRAKELFRAIGDGSLSVRVHSTFPLAEAQRAQELLESRESAGKILLLP